MEVTEFHNITAEPTVLIAKTQDPVLTLHIIKKRKQKNNTKNPQNKPQIVFNQRSTEMHSLLISRERKTMGKHFGRH